MTSWKEFTALTHPFPGIAVDCSALMWDTWAASNPDELEKEKQLFLDNMFHNIIFVSLKVSFDSKYQ